MPAESKLVPLQAALREVEAITLEACRSGIPLCAYASLQGSVVSGAAKRRPLGFHILDSSLPDRRQVMLLQEALRRDETAPVDDPTAPCVQTHHFFEATL